MGLTESNSKVVTARIPLEMAEELEKGRGEMALGEYIRWKLGSIQDVDKLRPDDIILHCSPALHDWLKERAEGDIEGYLIGQLEKASRRVIPEVR